MIDRRTCLLIMLLAIVLIVVAAFIGKTVPVEFSRINNRSAMNEDSTASKRLAIINAAVRAKPPHDAFEYTGGFENPFKRWNAPNLNNNRRREASPPRTMLSLKGILMKEQRPLAILENPMGETFIRGVGEKALDQLIVSISDNRVVMRDHLGTYELSVKEN